MEVRVPEDAPPSELLYTVLARDPDENDTFNASILDTVKLPRGAKLCSLSCVMWEEFSLHFTHLFAVWDHSGASRFLRWTFSDWWTRENHLQSNLRLPEWTTSELSCTRLSYSPYVTDTYLKKRLSFCRTSLCLWLWETDRRLTAAGQWGSKFSRFTLLDFLWVFFYFILVTCVYFTTINHR